ncbi:MAG: cellulose biosynthesis cyclic di-GMP-binding regulatory protein BcsB [Gemmatimonadales bacterium]
MPSRALLLLAALLVAACDAPTPDVPDTEAASGLATMDSLASGGGVDSAAAPPVAASPDSVVVATPTLAEIGYQEGITLLGAADRTTLTLPVPEGLAPRELRLRVLPTPRMPDATVILQQGARVLAQRALSDTATELVLPLSEVIVQQGRAIVDLAVNVPGRDACEAPLFYRTVFTPDGGLTYDGALAPVRSVSAFFAPWLRRVTFYLPAEPSLDAAQAALDVAAYVGRRYRGMGTRFVIGELPPDGGAIPEPQLDERAVVWATDGPAGILGPEGGRGTVLAIASRGDARALFTLPQGPALVPTSAFTTSLLRLDQRSAGTVSLDAMGAGTRTVQGNAIAAANYRFSLADFRSQAGPVAFRLVAEHASLPRETTGEATVLLNGAVIWSRPIDEGRIDATMQLPARLLARDNDLEIRFSVRLGEGACILGAPLFTATVLGESAFVLGGGEPFPPSYERFPAALVPEFSVLLEPRDRFRVELAATMIEAMQRTTATPMAPVLLRDAAEARGALLAVGTASLADRLGAPLATDGFRLRDTDGRVWDEYVPSQSYGAMQAFQADGRDVLLLHHTGADGAPLAALVRETLAPYGWFGVHGDLTLRGPESPAATITAANSGWRIEPIDTRPASFFARYRTMIFVGIGLLLLALVVWFYPRMVRRELDAAR